MDSAPVANCLGLLALMFYIATLIPTTLKIVFPGTKKTRFLVLSSSKKKIFWLASRTGLCAGLCGGEILTSLDDGDVVLFLFRFWF